MKILITGSSGKIGTKILDALADEDNQIIILSRQKREDRLSSNTQIRYCDITNPDSLEKAISREDAIDVVLHMAAVTHSNSKELYYKVNFEGTKNMIAVSEKMRIKKFIFISSRAACAGGGDYSESKLFAEEELKKSKLNWLILALGEVYGNGDRDMINMLFNLVDRFYIVPTIGSEAYKLAPLHIDDAVKAIADAVKRDSISKKRLIICGPDEISLNQLICHIVKLKKMRRIIAPIPTSWLIIYFWLAPLLKIKSPSYDQLQRLTVQKPCDISEAKIYLNFNPRKISDGFQLLNHTYEK